MISLVGGFFTWMCAKDEAHLLAVGLPDAGKTCLLEHAKRAFNRKHHMVPLSAITKTIGMNISTLQMPGLDVIVWDVGGKMRNIWSRYYSDADGLLFVFDASRPSEFDRVREALASVLDHGALGDDVPVALCANKVDVSERCADAATIYERILGRGSASDAASGIGGSGGTAASVVIDVGDFSSGAAGAGPPQGSGGGSVFGSSGAGTDGDAGGSAAGTALLGSTPVAGAAAGADGRVTSGASSTAVALSASSSSALSSLMDGRRAARLFFTSGKTGENVQPALRWLIDASVDARDKRMRRLA